MSDNRVRNNNDYRRESYRPVDRGPIDGGGRSLMPSLSRTQISPFQKLMEENYTTNDFSPDYRPDTSTLGTATNPATREAVKAVVSQQERYGKEKEQFEKRLTERESERDEPRSSSSRGVDGTHAKIAEKKVVARQSLSGQKNHGEGKGNGYEGGGGPGYGKRGKGFTLGVAVKGGRGVSIEKTKVSTFDGVLQMKAMEAVATTATAFVEETKIPSLLSKAVLDQLVLYCRLVTKTDGDKEMEMQLREEIFKGLRLRVSVVNGKVEATFVTHSREVLDLFRSQKADLHKALAEKGIDVRVLNVIMV